MALYPISYGVLLLLVQNVSDYYIPLIDNVGVMWILMVLTGLSVFVSFVVRKGVIESASINNRVVRIVVITIQQLIDYITSFLVLFTVNIITNKVVLFDSAAYTEIKFYVFLVSLIFVVLFFYNFIKLRI